MEMSRKQSGPMKLKRAAEAYAEIFRGIYWRHEFARRNETVAKESAELAKTLGIKDSRFEVFIHDGYPLTDDLIDLVSRPDREEASKALKMFLETHKVLPVTLNSTSKETFFPKEFGSDQEVAITYFADHLNDGRMIFKCLLLFEAKAMSTLGLGHPVFFPLMPLVVDKIKLERLKLGCSNAPTLFDRSVPKGLIGKYSDALDFEMENSDREKAVERIDQRIPWQSFSEFIEILDYAKAYTDKTKKAFKYEYYIQSRPEGEKRDAIKDYDNCGGSYRDKLQGAIFYRDHYQDII